MCYPISRLVSHLIASSRVASLHCTQSLIPDWLKLSLDLCFNFFPMLSRLIFFFLSLLLFGWNKSIVALISYASSQPLSHGMSCLSEIPFKTRHTDSDRIHEHWETEKEIIHISSFDMEFDSFWMIWTKRIPKNIITNNSSLSFFRWIIY